MSDNFETNMASCSASSNLKTDISLQRPDIARLSAEQLSYIANKGLVKRAHKALLQGDTPSINVEDDLTLTATFSDNSDVRWPKANAIYESVCSCPASTKILCRHQIQTALAYRQYYCQHFDSATLASLPAHSIDGTHIKALINNSNKSAVQTLSKSGINITLSFTDKDPCEMARLPMATVHFWGGNVLHQCTCDCQKKLGCEHIILAAVAFVKHVDVITIPTSVFINKKIIDSVLNAKPSSNRVLSDKLSSSTIGHSFGEDNNNQDSKTATPVRNNEAVLNTKPVLNIEPVTFTLRRLIQACQQSAPRTLNKQNNSNSVLMHSMLTQTLALLTENERTLFTQFYRFGINDGTDATATLIEDIFQENKQKSTLWLNDILQALKDWLDAYRTRRSDFELSLGNQLVSEYLLRRLAGQHCTLAGPSLGIGVAAHTDIRPTQLLGLGCQIQVYDDYYQAQTLLLDKKNQTSLLLHTSWQASAVGNRTPHPSAQSNTALNPILQHYENARLHRITSKLSLIDIQHGILSTQRSRRAANHSITLNKSRHIYNQWMPYRLDKDDIQALSAPLRFDSIEALQEYYQARPLSFARPRYQQPNFVILPISECLFKGYDSAQQTMGVLVQTSLSTINNPKQQHTDTPFWIKLNYRSHAPFALSLLANGFDDTQELPHHISGTLSWEVFGEHLLPVIMPWALFYDDHKVILALDLPKENKVNGEKKDLETYNWQNSPALASLPLVDFSKKNSSHDSIHKVLADCQSWLDEALVYGAQSLPNSFWRTQKQLVIAAQQVGLQQLASCLTYDHNDDLHTDHYLLMLVLQLAVKREIAAIP